MILWMIDLDYIHCNALHPSDCIKDVLIRKIKYDI